MPSFQLMTSAVVNVFDVQKKSHPARILLDTCATANFITESLVRSLNLPSYECNISIGSLNDNITAVNRLASVTFQSRYNDFKKTLRFLIVPKITDFTPNEIVAREHLNIPSNIRLADPKFNIPALVDMLIGAGATLSLLSVGRIHLSKCKNEDLYAQKTCLGWIIGGGSDPSNQTIKSKSSTCMLADLKNTLEKFWSLEEVQCTSNLSQEEIECEEHFKRYITRNKEGRYVVALPFKNTSVTLGESKATAVKRLEHLYSKFKNNSQLQVQYTEVIDEYLRLKHASPSESSSSSDGFYLPHHAIFKESSSTTKTRVVFDASAKSSLGNSLNDILMVGPKIQDDLFALLLRFRFYIFVIMADIEKMFRQFLVRSDDRKFQKFLWKIGDSIQELCLNTIIFGMASAPFLATRCLKQLAQDEGAKYPLAKQILEEDFYVDNMITGAYTLAEARDVYKQITALLSLACLNMRQWAANDRRVLDGVDEQNLDSHFRLDQDGVLKTLGVHWNAKTDSFLYIVEAPDLTIKITKRTILSAVAKIFDPLGLLGPVTLYAKVIIQKLWQKDVKWDESLPSDLHYRWIKFCEQLKLLNDISLPRRVSCGEKQPIEIHGFCDASECGYGACLYVKSRDDTGNYRSSLLCAKSRVAPLKGSTIPRLELCGALLLVDLYKKSIGSLKVEISNSIFWTDSEIVIHWIRSQPGLLKTFVANRVAEIQSITRADQWRHVRSNDNPADCLSRGQLPAELLNNSLWFHGPTWLCQSSRHWPQSRLNPMNAPLPESRSVKCLTSNVNPNIFQRYSSFSKLKRIIALCLRFTSKFRQCKGAITLSELQNAERVIIRYIQSVHFPSEMRCLQQQEELHKKSRLLNLNPRLGADGLLRIGGRLHYSDVPDSYKHAIILPNSNFVTHLIIKEYHLLHLHAGIQTTLYALRQKFWPIDGRKSIRRVIRECVTCFRARPRLSAYRMGELPRVRVNEEGPFHNVGIDYCGPFYIKERTYRNIKLVKAYVAVFICMSVKAIHIEVVGDLTTKSFLAALERFIARRGKPATIFCDNGSNFVGARNELNELHGLLNSERSRNVILASKISENIEFHFIPPASPHFGGLWEAGVKSFKHHFRRVASNAVYTYQELATLSAQIEAILNSRPLTPMSSDINDYSALTPGHFLIGKPLTSLPEANLTKLPSNRLTAWKLIAQSRQHFWRRWRNEYLNELNIRYKWQKNTKNPEEGMLVLLKEDNTPCMQWPLARIEGVHPGNDNIVRTVTLRTASGIFKRPVTKIAILPTSDTEPSDC